MKNKNGFTLVELLAVIVVLAVIMLLAVNAVIPQMNKARKSAFATEALAIIDAAESYYINASFTNEFASLVVSGTSGFDSWCVDIEDLKGEYLDTSKDIWGVVCFYKSKDSSSYKSDNYLISVSDGNYYFQNLDSDNFSQYRGQNPAPTVEDLSNYTKKIEANNIIGTSDENAKDYMSNYKCLQYLNMWGAGFFGNSVGGNNKYYKTKENYKYTNAEGLECGT